MAVTAMTRLSNRERNRHTLSGTVTGVAFDAVILEQFTLPAGFGDLWLDMAMCDLGAFSAAGSVGSDDGPLITVYGSDGLIKDVIGTARWTIYTSNSGRNNYAQLFDLNNRVLVRADDRITVQNRIAAAAGVTGTVDLFVRGIRLRQN